MKLKTFDEILTDICDYFDEIISPKTIARTNTNIIYLIFKAIAKGFEVINNVCVVLDNKFNPASCSDEDLESIASLVGTERQIGSSSGLYITAVNKGTEAVTLLKGIYNYALDDDTVFAFEVLKDTVINASEKMTFFAFSKKKGSYQVETQDVIQVYSNDVDLSTDLTFSCIDNSALLGTKDETNLEFRNRILTSTSRQDSLVELQATLKNLPYIFDVRIYFNNNLTPLTYDGITIPPYSMAIFFSGDARNEIAEIVASKGIYPTVKTDDSIELIYENSIFASGGYPVYVIPFKKTKYIASITYKLDTSYNTQVAVESEMSTKLLTKMNGQVHYDYVNEADIYNVITDLNILGVTLLNVDLYVNANKVDYVSIPYTKIPELTNVNFIKVD